MLTTKFCMELGETVLAKPEWTTLKPNQIQNVKFHRKKQASKVMKVHTHLMSEVADGCAHDHVSNHFQTEPDVCTKQSTKRFEDAPCTDIQKSHQPSANKI
mmetsp:Transcript_43591/g.72419  ORF Transcript_43591/g.72419 Transcript_43591/m.72419 type:complete len:101 (-) Transcript_43591:189-491(-)